MFPLPPLISKTLTKIEDNGITVPRWTATPWWDRLTHMAIDVLTTLGLSRNVCRAKIGASLPRLDTLVATVVRGTKNPRPDPWLNPWPLDKAWLDKTATAVQGTGGYGGKRSRHQEPWLDLRRNPRLNETAGQDYVAGPSNWHGWPGH